MKALITGGAGCIGSELVKRLLADGHEVVVYDNLSSGKEEHVGEFLGNAKFTFVKDDLLNLGMVKKAFKNIDIIFHLAANSDIKYSAGDSTDEDLRFNIIATYNVLESMRMNGVKKIVFTSSSAVYGEAKTMPTPEAYPLEPISLYGASKASCEALISGFSHMFGMRAWIFRFANIVGDKSRRTGKTVISEFIEKLGRNPRELQILGDGKQSKSYLLVSDCIDGVLAGLEKGNETVNTYNLGPDDCVTINEIAEIIAGEMKLHDVTFTYTGGDRGWTGDVPKFLLDNRKIKSLGWKPKHTSREAVRIAAQSLLARI